MGQTNWNFNVINFGLTPKNTGDIPESPYIPSSIDSKCPYINTQDGQCQPYVSGSVLLDLQLSNSSGCNLYSPFYISLFEGDPSSPNFLTGFSGVANGQANFTLAEGSYYFDISGQFNTDLQLPFSIGLSGFSVSGYNYGPVNSGDVPYHCTGLVPYQVSWYPAQTLKYSVEEMPEINGISSTGFIFDIAPGEYTVDFNNGHCNSQAKVEFNYNNGIGYNVFFTGISCTGNQNDGVAQILASGGIAPYSYAWFSDSNSNVVISTGTYISGLATGTYYCQLQDSRTCGPDFMPTAYIGINDNFLSVETAFTSAVQDRICCQEVLSQKADLIAIANGGTSPYSYMWNNGYTGIHLTGLAAGDYFVTVTDSKGCTSTSLVQSIKNVTDCLKVKWDFGNGQTQEYVCLPDQIYNTVTNPYYEGGRTYPVTLQVVDGLGNQGISCQNVTVPNCPPLDNIFIAADTQCINTVFQPTIVATAYNSVGNYMSGINLQVHAQYRNSNLPPYPSSSSPCTSGGLNSDKILIDSIFTNSSGQIVFNPPQISGNCVNIYAVANTTANPVQLVPSGVISNALLFGNCINPPTTPPTGAFSSPPFPDVPPGYIPPASPEPPPPDEPANPQPQNDNRPCSCCINDSYGRRCYGGMTVSSCLNGNPPGTVVTILQLGNGGFGSCGPANGNLIQDCDGNWYCQLFNRACCAPDGCSVRSKCECDQHKGHWYPNKTDCGDPEVQNACYSNCCINHVCTPNMAQKPCEDQGGRWGGSCKDCPASTGDCPAGCCPDETGKNCGSGCCCCPTDQAPRGPNCACIAAP